MSRLPPSLRCLGLGFVLAAASCGPKEAPRGASPAGVVASLPEPRRGADLVPEVRERVDEALRAARARPDEALSWFELGATYEGLGLRELALAAYEGAVARDRDLARGWHRLAAVRADAGDFSRAADAMEEVTRLAAHHGPAWWRRGFWLLDLDRPDQAAEAFRVATEVDPSSPAGWVGLAHVALRRGSAEEALRVLGVAADRCRPDPHLHLARANALRRLGRLDEAAAEMRAARRGMGDAHAQEFPPWADPWDAEVGLFRMGRAALFLEASTAARAGDHAAAARVLEAPWREDPADAELAWRLARYHLYLFRPADAHRVLAPALEANPGHHRLHLYRGMAFELDGDLQRALFHVSRAAELHPASAEAHARRAIVLRRLGRDELALVAIGRAVEREPASALYRVELGATLADLGRWAEAAQAHERALAEDPADSLALEGLAEALIHLERWREAEDVLTSAAARPGADPERLAELRGELEAGRGAPP